MGLRSQGTRMIYLNLTINNPFSDKFEPVYANGGKLFKHKAWEFQIYRSNTIAELEARATVREDHAGVRLGLGLFSWTVEFQLYDGRHWNYDKNCWEVYD